MVQIWCLLNCTTKEQKQTPDGSIKRKNKMNKVAKKEENKPMRPRGRPRKNAVEKAPAIDPKGQITQALVVHLPEEDSVIPADETMLSNHTPQHISTPVSLKEKHQNHAEKELQNNSDKEKHQKEGKKQKKPRGKARNTAIDKTPIKEPGDQFIPALVVHLPEDTLVVPPMGKIVPTDHAPKKGKERKRKAVNNETTPMEKCSGIPSSEGPSFQALAVEFPESIKNISPIVYYLRGSPGLLEEMGKKHTRKGMPATELECTLAVLRRKSRNKSKVCNNLDIKNSGSSTPKDGEIPALASLEEKYLRKDNRVRISEGNDAGNNLSDMGSGGSTPKEGYSS